MSGLFFKKIIEKNGLMIGTDILIKKAKKIEMEREATGIDDDDDAAAAQ